MKPESRKGEKPELAYDFVYAPISISLVLGLDQDTRGCHQPAAAAN